MLDKIAPEISKYGGTNKVTSLDVLEMLRDIANTSKYTTDHYILMIYGAMFLGIEFDFYKWRGEQL